MKRQREFDRISGFRADEDKLKTFSIKLLQHAKRLFYNATPSVKTSFKTFSEMEHAVESTDDLETTCEEIIEDVDELDKHVDRKIAVQWIVKKRRESISSRNLLLKVSKLFYGIPDAL